MLVDSCIIVDEEIKLKQLSLDNSKELFELTEKNKEFLLPWFEWTSEMSFERTKKFIINSIKSNKKSKGCDLGIYYKEQLIGVIALVNFNKIEKEAEISYWLSKDFNGKGIITRCCRKLEEYCFTKINFDKLYIIAFPENLASRAIPEKLGFKLIDADKDATIINNKKSYYIYYMKTQIDYKSNFWNHLYSLFNSSKVVIDSKKGEFNDYLKIVSPVDIGYLKNDWNEDDQIDIFIGSLNVKSIESIICTMDFNNKFSDIKILCDCTVEEKIKSSLY